jgi:Dolichyl-phosphate-mannose-protein mannosyltransferase
MVERASQCTLRGMTERGRERFTLISLLVLALGVFVTGLGWGLPSRAVDPLLFGDHPVWTGAQIAQLTRPRQNDQLGADVDANPAAPGSVVNDTDEKRAEIISRYRLYTYQPDEMITMKSLGSMNPSQRDFDPKLYQYGGLWIYPVGTLIKLCLNPQSQTFYLDQPVAFGRFYLIARLYVVLWGLIGAWAVYRIALDCGAGMFAAAGVVLLYLFLPVVVNMSHEAKPHLPGAVLVLLAAMCAGRFVQDGRARWWVLSAILCGMSAGIIVSNALALVILPAMVMMRSMKWSRRCGIAACAVAIGVAVYSVTNPYVLVHVVGNDAVLRSNLGNSRAMYSFGRIGDGLVNAGRLLVEGSTPLVGIVGLIGSVLVARRSAKRQVASLRILLIVAGLVLVQFVLLAAGKPGEYGRFAILPAIVLALSAATLIGRAPLRTFEKIESLGLLLVLTILPSLVYLHGFVRDSGPEPRRLADAAVLEQLHRIGATTLGVDREPAPYRLPPVNLFEWRIVLLPDSFDLVSGQAPVDVIVRPVDELKREPTYLGAYVRVNERRVEDLFPARISWASKPMEIWVRRGLLMPGT